MYVCICCIESICTIFILLFCIFHIAGGVDFSDFSQTIQFFGVLPLEISVGITNDFILENAESFSVEFTSDDDSVILQPSTATVTIIDNDGE